MKKLLFLFVSIVSLSVTTSCSSDDDKNANASVQGKWYFHSQFYSSSSNVTPADSDYTIYHHNCSSKKNNVEFKANGVATYNWHYDTCENDPWDENWSLSGNILIWTSDGIDDRYEVMELTNSSLKLREITESQTYYIKFTR